MYPNKLAVNIAEKQNRMPLPNLVIAGAPKSGTTSLFKWLQAHPSVVTSRDKETYFLMDRGYPFFREKASYLHAGIDGYEKLFPEYEPGLLCIEATPDYMYQQTALKVLSELPTRPLIVFILRNPVERVLSLFEFARNNVGSLSVSVSARDFFERAKNQQFSNDHVLNHALQHSEYADWLERWITACGRDRVEVLFFDELAGTPLEFMRKLCQRVGIDATFYETFVFKAENQSRQIRSAALLQLKNFIERHIPQSMLGKPIRIAYRKLNIASASRRSEDDATLIAELREYFVEPNRRLAALLNRALPAGWLGSPDSGAKACDPESCTASSQA